jgi:hypothetical protein
MVIQFVASKIREDLALDNLMVELEKSIMIMAKGQLNKDHTPEQVSDLKTFLKALTVEVLSDARQVPVAG